MKTRDVRRRAATRSGRFGAARLRFRLSSGSCLVAVRTGRVRCRVWFYGSTITDAKRFEVIIDGAQHGCGRVANSRNAACTVRRKLHRGARVVSCRVVSRHRRAYVGGGLHVAAGGMTSSSVGVGGVARVYPFSSPLSSSPSSPSSSLLSAVVVARCPQPRRASCCSRDKV